MATHSSVLAWRIPGTGEPGGLPDVYGVAQSRTRLKRLRSSIHSQAEEAVATHSVLLPGKSHGWRSLVGCSPWGRKELDMTE